MATLTVGKGKTYDYNQAAITAAADTDSIDIYYTEIDGEPGVYWESLNIPATKTLTFTGIDDVWIKNRTINWYLVYCLINSGKTHTFTNINFHSSVNPRQCLYCYNHVGDLTISRCTFVNTSGDAALLRPSATGTLTLTSNLFIGDGTVSGAILQSGGAGASSVVYNNTFLNTSDRVGIAPLVIDDTNNAIDAQNNFMHNFHTSAGASDCYAYNGTLGAQAASNRSTDGTLSTTDIGDLSDAEMVDPNNFDVHIKTGSSLDGVGNDVGTITDIDGNSVDTGVNPFVGCSSIASAPAAPSNLRMANLL